MLLVMRPQTIPGNQITKAAFNNDKKINTYSWS